MAFYYTLSNKLKTIDGMLLLLLTGSQNSRMGYRQPFGVLYGNSRQEAWSNTFVYSERSSERRSSTVNIFRSIEKPFKKQ